MPCKMSPDVPRHSHRNFPEGCRDALCAQELTDFFKGQALEERCRHVPALDVEVLRRRCRHQ